MEGDSLGTEQDSRNWGAPSPFHARSLLIFPGASSGQSLKSLSMPLSAKRACPYLEAVASRARLSSPFFPHLLSPPHCPLLCCWQICLFIRGNKLDVAQTSCLNGASVMNWVPEGSSRLLLLPTPREGRQQSNAHECTAAFTTCRVQF